MLRFAWKLSLFAALALGAEILMTLDYGYNPSKGLVHAVSIRWPALNSYHPDSQVALFQGYMKTDPVLGFVFKENLGEKTPIELRWADQDPGPLTTDENGFVNSPYAIAARREGRRPQIIGVGSSFMQGAANKFHEFFWAKGLFYYNMAVPRHTLPQFTNVVRNYAVPLKPDWILYDLNETSFELLPDYEAWTRSGMDWFTYHSGTWCGPVKTKPPLPLKNHPALEALYRGIRRKIAPESPVPKTPPEGMASKSLGYIVKAWQTAQANGINFVVVVIPGKDIVVYGRSEGWKNVEALLPLLQKAGVPVLNLRPVFESEGDPSALYYRVDAHWNDYGIYKAGLAVSEYIILHAKSPNSRTGRPS